MTDEARLTEALQTAGWQLSEDGKAIERSYRFGNFRDALAWMVRAGLDAESMDHHPEWSNVYNRVSVRLTTHDAGGLTDKDLRLAEKMEAAAQKV